MTAPAIRSAELDVQTEPWDKFFNSGQGLFALHREEVTQDKDLMVLAPDVDYYTRAEKAGRLLIVTARHAGVLVGYVLWHLHPHPHYKNVLTAQDDVHYLHPAYRRGMTGYLLLKKAIAILPTFGVQYWYVREKIGHEHPAMMRRLGLKPLDVTYCGRVEK